MENSYYFDRNLLALSQKNPELCSRLSGAETTLNRYKFLESRSGEVIPAWVDSLGAAHPLHSIMDPKREAKRLIESMKNEGFLVLLGLGGGYYAEAALEQNETEMVLAVEYDINGLAELLCHRNYAHLFGDPRFRLLADAGEEELEQQILNMYQPVLYGGIKVIPLRSRTSLDTKPFTSAGNAIERAIDKISADYSVQAYFGNRWFSNIIRNLGPAGEFQETLPPISKAAVTAAGPSLSLQIGRLREKRKEFFLIAADTSLPCLLNEGIKPDAVISIDCQHISYYHFMDGLPPETFLFLDLASPPLLASLSQKRQFFSGGHPLTRYISKYYRSLPELDTSGGNVTYAAISLAEQLGAREIELYGADFSYPEGISYARGTYIYSYFGNRQNRFSSLEAQISAFLFRNRLEKIIRANSWYYESKALRFYRENLEEKSARMETSIIPVDGLGAPIAIRNRDAKTGEDRFKPRQKNLKLFSSGKPLVDAEEFLRQYRNEILMLPKPGINAVDYLKSLKTNGQSVFTTILPAAAAIKRRSNIGNFRDLLEETKIYCLEEINTVLSLCKGNGGISHK